MYKFYSSSQILAITRDLPLKSCIKIRSCQGIWVHLGGVGGGGGNTLKQHTKVAVRPHMVLDTKRQPSPESNLKCLFVVVRALAFHQCVPGSIPGPGVICGLSLLVLYSAPRGFSPGTPVFPSPQKPTFDLI